MKCWFVTLSLEELMKSYNEILAILNYDFLFILEIRYIYYKIIHLAI